MSHLHCYHCKNISFPQKNKTKQNFKKIMASLFAGRSSFRVSYQISVMCSYLESNSSDYW